jgi:SnoaL-like domain
MIDQTIESWHRFLAGDRPQGLEGLLADDVVFYSPVVYTPQRGREVAILYLEAARVALGGDGPEGGFRYTKQVVAGDLAVLEFETTVVGKYVNGVDIIRIDGFGRIVEFRVMIRPLQAINTVHEQMGAMLASMRSAPGATRG